MLFAQPTLETLEEETATRSIVLTSLSSEIRTLYMILQNQSTNPEPEFAVPVRGGVKKRRLFFYGSGNMKEKISELLYDYYPHLICGTIGGIIGGLADVVIIGLLKRM